MPAEIGHDKPLRDQLTENREPAAAVEFGTDGKGLQLIMSEPLDPLTVGPEQYIDQVMRAKTLPGPVDRGERFLRDDGSIPARDRLAAIVAVAAGWMVGLAEIAEQHLPPTRDRFAIADQRLGLLPFDAALIFGRIARSDQPNKFHDVGNTVAHHASAGSPSRPARPVS